MPANRQPQKRPSVHSASAGGARVGAGSSAHRGGASTHGRSLGARSSARGGKTAGASASRLSGASGGARSSKRPSASTRPSVAQISHTGLGSHSTMGGRGNGTRGNGGGGKTLMTRRNFLYGALGVGAAAAAIGVGVSIAGGSSDSSSVISTLTVPASSVFTLEGCTEIGVEEAFGLVGSFELPLGTLVWAGDGGMAACLVPTEQASPLTQVSLLSLSSGNTTTVLKEAVGKSEGFEIYDVRTSADGLLWTEANILEGTWRIMAAPISSSGSVGDSTMLDFGGDDVQTPGIAAVGSSAFWVSMPPATASNAKTGKAVLKRARFSTGTSEVLFESKGRMAAPLYACDGGVVITPKNSQSSSYYELRRIDEATGQTTDSLVLPSSMVPNQVGYGADGFAFCFESIYDYGDGIANLGTYTPAAPHTQGNSYNGLTWFRFGRTPLSSPCWCTDAWFMVKSTQSVAAINLAQKIYCVFGVESGCTDWGDYLASTGTSSSVVTVMQIDQTDTSGTAEQKTLVRVWKPVSA